jgi:hypothetical protein
VNVGTAHASASYAGDANHNGSNGADTFAIVKADASCTIVGYSVTYDASSHTASGSCLGVDGSTVLAGLVKSGTTHTNAGTYTGDAWTFTDVTGNYHDASGTVNDAIGKATPTVSVTWASWTFDGAAHPASGSVTGVGSPAANLGTPTLTYYTGATATGSPLSGAPSAVGTYTVLASYAETANYKAASATKTVSDFYRWDGFLQPINDTAHQVGTSLSVFKGGSTVPVKFQLKKLDGTVVPWNGTSAVPVWQTPLQGSAMTAAPNETVYTDAATSGGVFRWDSTAQQWIYNWSTKGFKTGYWWKVCATFDDGQTQCAGLEPLRAPVVDPLLGRAIPPERASRVAASVWTVSFGAAFIAET